MELERMLVTPEEAALIRKWRGENAKRHRALREKVLQEIKSFEGTVAKVLSGLFCPERVSPPKHGPA